MSDVPVALTTHKTLLTIYGMGQPLYSGRGLTQTHSPIDAASQIEEDIDGVTMDLSFDGFKKYQTEITCTDVESLSWDGVWPGTEITIDCVFELSYITDSGAPTREMVEGSERTEGDYTFYRPRLDCVVTAWDNGFQEYSGDYTWRLRAVEKRVPVLES